MSTTRAIPVSLKDRSDIDFSTSLGGTLYGTTPGGTKIVYDRNALLQYRNSPLSKTPPPQLAHITNTELNKKVEKSTTTPTTTTPPTTTAKPKPTNDDVYVNLMILFHSCNYKIGVILFIDLLFLDVDIWCPIDYSMDDFQRFSLQRVKYFIMEKNGKHLA
ncbi:hypothetical protein ACTFIZ_006110 [Dictyostelium cf. discoideum]